MAEPRLTLDDIAADPGRAMALSLPEAAALLAQVGAVEVSLRTRVIAGTNGAAAGPELLTPAKSSARMLTLPEAAERVRKSVRWMRDHWRTEMPFARKVGKSILFPESALERWLQRP